MAKKDITNFFYFNNETQYQIMQEMENHPIFYKNVKINYIDNKRKINIYMENVVNETIDADNYDVIGPLKKAIAIVDKIFSSDNAYEDCQTIEKKEIKLNDEKSDINTNYIKRFKSLNQIYHGLSIYKTIVIIILIMDALGLIILTSIFKKIDIFLYSIPSLILSIGFIFLIDYNIFMVENMAEIDKDVERINETRKIR